MNKFKLLAEKVLRSVSRDEKEVLSKRQIAIAYELILERMPSRHEYSRYKNQGLEFLLSDLLQTAENKKHKKIKIYSPELPPSIDIATARVILDFEPYKEGAEPSLEKITSQLCTASQFESPIYNYWCDKIKEPPRLHRKQWEFVFILEALNQCNMLNEGKKGLGFGCGKEPLGGVFVDRGATVLCTDLSLDDSKYLGWSQTNQHARSIDDIYRPGVCDRKKFLKNLSYMNVDMNNIPENLLNFDFVWSSCALEHLGSIDKGLEFIKNSIKCLKPGGIAVHTTEFNLSSNDDTLEHEDCVFFRKQDFEKLNRELEGFAELLPVNYCYGSALEDQYIDLPPYKSAPHLKLAMLGYLTTSIGLVIKKSDK